jgi:hypothetical protein
MNILSLPGLVAAHFLEWIDDRIDRNLDPIFTKSVTKGIAVVPRIRDLRVLDELLLPV